MCFYLLLFTARSTNLLKKSLLDAEKILMMTMFHLIQLIM